MHISKYAPSVLTVLSSVQPSVCLNRLEERYRDLHPDIDWSTHDEIESIASASGSFPAWSTSRLRFGGHVGQERKAEKLRTKVISLESENQKLKQQTLFHTTETDTQQHPKPPSCWTLPTPTSVPLHFSNEHSIPLPRRRRVCVLFNLWIEYCTQS